MPCCPLPLSIPVDVAIVAVAVDVVLFCSPYINNETVDASMLLAQSLQDFGLKKYQEYQRLADKAGVGLRISETNSL